MLRYKTWHPHTKEECYLSNKEWRCIKVNIPTTSTLWELVAAEKSYIALLREVTQRNFSDKTFEWMQDMLLSWPTDVCSSPSKLTNWYYNLTTLIDIDAHDEHLAVVASINIQLKTLQENKHRDAVLLVKRLQKDLERMRRESRRKERMKIKRKAAQLKALRRRGI